jgi:RNA polymerase sigma-70 factor (ECF subfamily)
MATGILRRLALASPVPAASVAGNGDIQNVYQAHFPYVWRCLRGLGVAEHALEDAAHDVFIVVQRRLSSFDGADAQLTTWLYEIALRIARRYRTQSAKDARRWVSLVPTQNDEGDVSSPASVSSSACDLQSDLERTERLALARRALEALDADKREAFVLGCVEQRSAPEVAQLTGVPLNTVYSRIRAARRLFAAEIARLESSAGRRAR